jgi:hypothetical protein
LGKDVAKSIACL